MSFWDEINNMLAIVVLVGAVVFVLGGLVFGLNRKPMLRASQHGRAKRAIDE